MKNIEQASDAVVAELKSHLAVIHELVGKLKSALNGERARGHFLEAQIQRMSLEAGFNQWKAIENRAEVKTLTDAVACLEAEISRLGGLLTDSENQLMARESVDRIINHDLRNSLITSIAVPELLLQDEDLSDLQREVLEGMIVNARRMLQLADLNQALYKMERGEFKLDERRVDVMKVLRDVLDGNSKKIQVKSVEIEIVRVHEDMSSGEEVFVGGNEVLLYYALSNLIINAVDASEQGGKVLVEMTRGDVVDIRISNHGEVPASIRDNFFEKYVTSGKKHGTGMGTYSAMLIVKAHGGDILLDCSMPGRTAVSVRLPSCQ